MVDRNHLKQSNVKICQKADTIDAIEGNFSNQYNSEKFFLQISKFLYFRKIDTFHLVEVIIRVEVKENKVDLSVSMFVKGYVSCDATMRHTPYPGGHLKYSIIIIVQTKFK